MKTVPRIGRILDLVGLAFFLAGGALFARAWIGFRGVPDYVPPPDASGWAAVAMADEFWRLQKIGGGLMVVGVAVFVAAWWAARSAARRAPPEAGDSLVG